MVAEKDLYDPMGNHLRRKSACWLTDSKVNVRNVGEIDVLGVRYLGGDLSGQSELVAVEVKTSAARFAVSAGQAHGYGVAADRSYLAVVCQEFTAAQVLVAGRLGVGLIRIRLREKKQPEFQEVLTAPPNNPIEELRLQAAEKLGLAQCSLCRTLFRRYANKADDLDALVRVRSPGTLRIAAARERGLLWWLSEQADEHGKTDARGETYLRRYLCPSCVWALGPGED